MSTKNGDKPTTTTATTQSQPSRLEVPDGDIVIRKVAGTEGTHPLLGFVCHSRVYTVTFAEAVRLTQGEAPEFKAVYPDDRKRLNGAQAKAKTETKKD